ncbi:hypothetical protein Nepgr_006249 [Nepenthes gracilis]|uniref:Uncharacterized protein n=1 Tax=Nepenthes gracilis TaxID=150966 RepID=A0AAD3XH83_NEPGR|nr:hypothetical protein Nepgr_006249 [Nepenthes gracilis]
MAFHIACPITCKRICFCELGFPRKLQSGKGRSEFLEEITSLGEFLKDPWIVRVKERGTVQVPVPKVVLPPPPPVAVDIADGAAEELLSAQTRRAVLQKKAAVASMAAEDFARKFESGSSDIPRELAREEQAQSNVNAMCRLCFCGEIDGSERAKKMLSCRSCSKKYHRSCLKVWAQHRDLFHWSSWTCPSCRVCEVCRRTGEPNKFKFCKRCDGAYHCYCMQPPHKNVSSGPYLCPKHTKCHSCGSNVPGNGLSVRWFLGYTCCDACGRLFTKGNYCPACLKVYRDSESTPMVCCDICQRWVHCQCDRISDEQYLLFQVDGNLPYTCPTCRGECYQVRDLDDAVQELWRRRDEADRDLISNLRAAAGLPSQEEIFSISPFSDDEDNGPFAVKNEYGRVKLSFKGLTDVSPKITKEYGKKSSNKKSAKKKVDRATLQSGTEFSQSLVGHQVAQSVQYRSSDGKDGLQSHKNGPEKFSSPVAGSLSPAEEMCSINQQGVLKHKFVDEVAGNNEDKRTGDLQMKRKMSAVAGTGENMGKDANKPKPMKGTKLVIHLGGRNRTITNSPMSDSSSYHREHESTAFNPGSEAVSQHRTGDKYSVDGLDSTTNLDGGHKDDSLKHKDRGGNLIKLGKGRSEDSDLNPRSDRGNCADGNGLHSPVNTGILYGKRSNEVSTASVGLQANVPEGGKASLRKHDSKPDISVKSNKNGSQVASVSEATPTESKPLLKLKFKNPYQGSWAPNGEEEKGSVKGQRSKRRRPFFAGKLKLHEDEDEDEDVTERHQDDLMGEVMDANWILRKLGKDAVGKRVEVHQSSDNSWHRGVVSVVIEGTSMLSVDLDDEWVAELRIPTVSNGFKLSSNIIFGRLTTSKKVLSCPQIRPLRTVSSMVVSLYHQPLFSVAPMMDWTDNHYRTLARLISKHAWLYTEMIAAETIVYQSGNLDRFLGFSSEQHPIVLQIGGSNLENLAKAVELANAYGYDEINFNCGCPSPRVVGHGCFGVRLMLDPKFVAEAMSVIAANTDVPVTVKCRIGVDDHDSYNELCDFIYKVSSLSPTKHFLIHSRKALLNGITPTENRTIPPLKYEYYFGLLRDFPDLRFTINGGINSIEEVNAARRAGAHGVMVGRAAFYNPWQVLGVVDTAVYGAPPRNVTRRKVLEEFQIYGDSVLGIHGNNRPNVRDVVKPLLNLFHSEPGNSLWKRKADAAFRHCTTIKAFLEETLVAIPDSVMDSAVVKAPVSHEDPFTNVQNLIPPPYEASEPELLYA